MASLSPLRLRPEGRSLRADIHLGRIQRNLARIRSKVDGRGVWAVVKANAYGHGAVQVSKALVQGGAHGLAVSSLEEALELREGGISAPDSPFPVWRKLLNYGKGAFLLQSSFWGGSVPKP